jgi:hypothetical protein
MRRTNFTWLFGGILLLLLLEPAVQTGRPDAALAMEGAFTSLLLVGVWSLRSFRRWFPIALGLVALDLASVALSLSLGGLVWSLLAYLSFFGFCLLSTALTLRFILTHREIDLNHLMGAMSAYLLLGMIWAALFAILRLFDPGALTNLAVAPGQPGEVGELLYFSFVTLTTLGYGDLTPVSPLARNLALLEAVVGQLFVAVLIATLIGRIARPPSARSSKNRSP